MGRTGILIALVLSSLVAGCDVLIGLLSPTTVTITLVNSSPSFNVDGTLVYAEDELSSDVLDQLGTEVDFSVDAGGVSRSTRDCDEVKSLRLMDADLRVIAGVSPDTNSGVLVLGDDFECGDEIVFTFTHSGLIVDFNVTVTTVSRPLPGANP